MAAESLSTLIFTGPLSWTDQAACTDRTELFFAPAGERPEARAVREGKARAVCSECEVLMACRDWAREHREYGFWGGESEEERAAAGFRVDMPVGRVARYPRGNGEPVEPREGRVARSA
jgi:WhiB family redox-sensing transcriptional regulator